MDEYKLVKAGVLVRTPDFSKEEFFKSGMGVSITLGNNFRDSVLSEITRTVYDGGDLKVNLRDIGRPMTDGENLREINEKLFSPNEWARVLYFGTKESMDGFFTTESINLSYIRMKKGIRLAVYAVLDADGVWRFGANALDNRRRDDGRRLFSKSR